MVGGNVIIEIKCPYAAMDTSDKYEAVSIGKVGLFK